MIVSPPEVNGLVVLLVALAGAAVNLLATWQLSQANRASMNVEPEWRRPGGLLDVHWSEDGADA